MNRPPLWTRAWRKLLRTLAPTPGALYPLRRPLPLPANVTAQELRTLLQSVRPEGASEPEMAAYVAEDFDRFVLTWSLAQDLTGSCLELGANPYFTTMLLRQYTPLQLTLANYFGPHIHEASVNQRVHVGEKLLEFVTHHFNIELDRFPFEDASFDVVLCCEILEHLHTDPWHTLHEIHRILRPGGTLILTTPNVARLENVAKMLAGVNLYDPYSGYGPYGRHNREYTLAELRRLSEHMGFEVTTLFSADLRDNQANHYALPSQYRLTRRDDLGQTLFLKANRTDRQPGKRPGWLYRSYPAGELD